MIYVDQLRRWPQAPFRNKWWAHLTTDGSIEELHAFARSIGLKRQWFQEGKPIWCPHYDVTPSKYRLALLRGAQLLTDDENAAMVVEMHRKWKEQRELEMKQQEVTA